MGCLPAQVCHGECQPGTHRLPALLLPGFPLMDQALIRFGGNLAEPVGHFNLSPRPRGFLHVLLPPFPIGVGIVSMYSPKTSSMTPAYA